MSGWWFFIHVPKTGGISLTHELGGHRSSDPRFGGDHQHMTAREIEQRHPEEWAAGWSFGFVRNPYTRVASLACNALKRPLVDYELDHWAERASPAKAKRPATVFLCGADGAPMVDVFYFELRAAALLEIADHVGRHLPGANRNAGPVSQVPGELARMYEVPGQIEHVRDYYASDFDLWGYPRDFEASLAWTPPIVRWEPDVRRAA